MKTKLLLPASISILLTIVVQQYSSAQWTTLNSGSGTDIYWNIFFIDPNLGYSIGLNGQTLNYWAIKTTNGGLEWNPAPNALIKEYPISIFFTDTNTGYISCTDKISKTTNGGLSWTPYSLGLGSNVYLNSIYFFNSSVGYATAWNTSTNANYMVHTSNAGISWTASAGGASSETGSNSIFCTDANTCYATGFYGGNGIYKTTNGGTIWTNIFNPSDVKLYSICFTSALNGIVVGGNNNLKRIYQTTDGGANWNQVYNSNGSALKSVCFTEGNTGYTVGGNGTILNTSDGGMNWNPMESPTTKDLYSVYFPLKTIGYAAGVSGTILKYTMPTDVRLNTTENNKIRLYPNPARGYVTIEISQSLFSKELSLELIDIKGETIKEINLQNPVSKVYIGSLKRGLYLYRIKNRIKIINSGKLII